MSEGLSGAQDDIVRWSGEFRCSALEQAYQASRWSSTARQLRLVAGGGALAYLSALYFNLLAFDSLLPVYAMGMLRVLAVIPLLLVFLVSFGDHYSRNGRLWMLTGELIMGLSETVEFHLYLQQSGSLQEMGTPFILFAILTFYTVFPNRVALILCAGVVTGLMLPLYLLLWVDDGLAMASIQLIYVVMVNVLGLAMLSSWNRMGRLEFAHQQQLRHEVEERKRAEAQALAAREAAEQANRAKSQFLARMNHELRTPLNGVLGGVELLREAPLRTEQQAQLDIIGRSGKQLAALINDVLDLAQIEAGQLKLATTDFTLAELLEDVNAILRHQTRGRPLVLETHLDEAIPEVLQGDLLRLKQVLINLGGNALKFTEQGRVLIEAALLERHESAVHLMFQVSDSGIGLSAQEQEKIFSPFTQADDTIRRRYGGSGLGLAICRELVSAMGGTLRLESEKGEGSRFSFELELPLGEATGIVQPDPTQQAAPLTACSLLLVEDLEANQAIASALLTRMGASVKVAGYGAEGVRLAEAGGFDAILMDLHMPDMDGLEACRRIRGLADPARAQTPIIALSADNRQQSIDACEAAGMQGFIAKPMAKADLQRVLAFALGRSDGGELQNGHIAEGDAGDERLVCEIDSNLLADIRDDLGEESYRTVIKACIRSLRELLEEIKTALQANDSPSVAKAGHRLKGVAGNYGLLSLHQQACRLEKAARTGDQVMMQSSGLKLESLTDSSISRLG